MGCSRYWSRWSRRLRVSIGCCLVWELTSSAVVTAVAAPAGATSAIAAVDGAVETLSSSLLALSFSLSSPNYHAPGSCGPVLILPGIAGRGTLPVSIKLEEGDLSIGLMVPPTGFPVDI